MDYWEVNMDILEFALKMEKDGEKLYQFISKNTTDKGFKTIFQGLAKDEAQHYSILKDLETQEIGILLKRGFIHINNVFEKKIPINLNSIKYNQIQVYSYALSNEKESIELYKGLAEETVSDNNRDMFLKLMNQEQKHYEKIDAIITLIEQGRDWVESAEFNKNSEEY
jgi:rubrerythrin